MNLRLTLDVMKRRTSTCLNLLTYMLKQGTKHEFNSLFSRGPKGKGVQPKGTLALLRDAMGGKNTQHHKGTDQKQRVDMPLAWQPASAISGSSSPNLQHHATTSTANSRAATKPYASTGPGRDLSDEESKGQSSRFLSLGVLMDHTID